MQEVKDAQVLKMVSHKSQKIEKEISRNNLGRKTGGLTANLNKLCSRKEVFRLL